MAGAAKISVKVIDVVEVNELVKRFKFERTDGGLMPTFSGGAHTVVEMNDQGTRRLNPYSLMSSPTDRSAYTISVRRDDEGRGGSLYLHNHVKPGMEMTISNPVNLFSLDLRARKHIFFAGGIGITPFLSQIKQLSAANNGHFELHYAVRTASLGSYADELLEHFPNNVDVYHDDKDQQIPLDKLLEGQPLGTHIYVCGPKGMINWILSGARKAGWPEQALHYEEFLAPEPGKAFDVELAVTGKTIHVKEQQSLLEAIEAAGVDAPYLCRGGACGMCETQVIRSEGDFIHNDHWLTDEEHASGEKIMPCVSRFDGKSLVLDR
jgi:ferredoxin-NADP reductase